MQDYIFNLCSFVAAFSSWGGSDLLWKAYKKSKIESQKEYSLAFFFVGLGFFILAFPRLVLFNPFLVQIDFLLVDISFLGAILFFTPATLSFSERLLRFKKKFFWLIFSWTLLYIFLNIFFFSPAVPLKIDGLIYYWRAGTPWLQGITRGLLCFGALGIAAFFVVRAKTLKGKILFWRSFFAGLGLALISIAGFLLWFFPFFYFSPKVLILSGILGILGFVMEGTAAVIFQPPRQTFVSKIS